MAGKRKDNTLANITAMAINCKLNKILPKCTTCIFINVLLGVLNFSLSSITHLRNFFKKAPAFFYLSIFILYPFSLNVNSKHKKRALLRSFILMYETIATVKHYTRYSQKHEI